MLWVIEWWLSKREVFILIQYNMTNFTNWRYTPVEGLTIINTSRPSDAFIRK